MNTYKTIDYTIRIFPEIIHHKPEILLYARIELPTKETICVQRTINILDMLQSWDRVAQFEAECYSNRIAQEIKSYIGKEIRALIEIRK